MEQLQSHIWLIASSYMGKYLCISSYIRKPFLVYDFATALRKIWFSFLSVYPSSGHISLFHWTLLEITQCIRALINFFIFSVLSFFINNCVLSICIHVMQRECISSWEVETQDKGSNYHSQLTAARWFTGCWEGSVTVYVWQWSQFLLCVRDKAIATKILECKEQRRPVLFVYLILCAICFCNWICSTWNLWISVHDLM